MRPRANTKNNNNNKSPKRCDEKLWSRLKKSVTSGDKGGAPAQWSARKAQMLVRKYKQAGGKFCGGVSRTKSPLYAWTKQKWRTKSGMRSRDTGERYLPAAAIMIMPSSVYKASSAVKREALRRGIQYSRQPLKARILSRKIRQIYRKLV